MDMYTVYVLKNSGERFYIGHTSKSAQERTSEHKGGKNRWTRNKGSWVLVHAESYVSKGEASRREKQIKKYKGGRAFKALIASGKNNGEVA